jgi:hypothetical protein
MRGVDSSRPLFFAEDGKSSRIFKIHFSSKSFFCLPFIFIRNSRAVQGEAGELKQNAKLSSL